jgi:gluconokinase
VSVSPEPPAGRRGGAAERIVILLMGVAGAGKSTVGARLAASLGCAFHDGDDLHPEANVRKMAAGLPLDDHDRAPWLTRIARLIREHEERREPAVVACSALKRAYRRTLLAGTSATCLVYLRVERPELEHRLRERPGHFFDPRLLPSQLATLEEPEEALTVDAAAPVDAVVAEILKSLKPSLV